MAPGLPVMQVSQATSGAAPDPRRAAEAAARHSYGRLVAWLAWRWRDLAAAEDALADALLAALETWPADGVPAAPEAWLLTVAKRRLLQQARHERVASDPAVSILFEDAAVSDDPAALPDARLRLLFVCAHPAIDERARTPLMLQCVLGMDARRIADAFVTSPAAMAQRLVRAKNKIRDSGIAFEEPERSELPGRVRYVLEAIYAAYGAGWGDPGGDDAMGTGLADEALFLARLVAEQLPGDAEALGLVALILYCESRRAARFGPDGCFVPLSEQEVSRWDPALHAAAESLLERAAARRQTGPFQIEAAIQSAHMQRLRGGATPWRAIAALYDTLAATGASGVLVSRAMAHAEAFGTAAGIAALDTVPPDSVRSYQPYWVARASLLARTGDTMAAKQAFAMAIGLTESPALRAHLEQVRNRLDEPGALDGS